ncbi:hypothetical protein B0I26_12133 [Anoxybacillus vitaminiphilus]|uniref:Lipoprotein n=1 Tax=Paranoxybacillus vitaminiphilus TaxID=581036 RepID=A0A327Y372_9BACL|nr:hypothetical protein [Anoxybacillus vitaminiphilus]RAK15463.1 hypothetical protein B0I26_12133 [Anoxybacillus vitaminiphilus]
MKNRWKILTMLVLVLSLISGCGTKEDNKPVNSSQPAEEQKDNDTTLDNEPAENPKKEDEPTSNSKTAEASKNENDQDEQPVRLLEKQLSYTIDGKTHEETAFLKTSDNQGFSMYVFEGWELEAEEPNSDVLLKDDLFVRIRLIYPEDAEVDYTKMVEDHAKTVSSEVYHNETTGLNGILKDAVWWKAYTEDTAVNVLWIKEKTPMLVIIHTPRDQEVLEPIFAMIETIEKTAPDAETKN